MKLADGVDFHLGMTLYFPGGEAYETSPETHVIDEYDYGDHLGIGVVYSIGRTNVATTDLKRFYSSRASAIDAQIGGLRQSIVRIEQEIAELEAMK